MIAYFTMGIIFSADLANVYLLRKDHPEWQAGLLNGVGGKVEQDETYAACMIREGREEAGYTGEWNYLGKMHGENDISPFNCEVFYSVMAAKTEKPKTCEVEKIEKHPVADLHALIPQMVPHLPMLILASLAYNAAGPDGKFTLSVEY